jgi:uncharacterized protein (TIGR00255 family)
VIRSMTGFASVTREAGDVAVHVTAKSVNHRFLDIALKAPSSLGAVEARVRAAVQERLARGRVELTVVVESSSLPEREVALDERLIDRVAALIESARARGVVSGGLTASDVLRIPHAIEIRPPASSPAGPTAELADLVVAAVADAVDALRLMRETEGRFIAADLAERLGTILGFVNVVEGEAREGQRHLETRLRERLDLLPADLRGDEGAIARELVRFVARSDVDEEVVRLRSHLEHWQGLAAAAEPCGRQLDFLVQEMNREINTIGSKVESVRATETVIAAKAELERIREQVQNVE